MRSVLILACLEKDPGDRPQSMKDIEATLRAIAADPHEERVGFYCGRDNFFLGRLIRRCYPPVPILRFYRPPFVTYERITNQLDDKGLEAQDVFIDSYLNDPRTTPDDKLGIEVTDEEINGHIAQLAIQQRQRPEKLKDEMTRNGSLAQFKLEIRQNKCIAKLLESAKITEKEPEKIPEKPAKKAAKKPHKKADSDEKK